MIKIRNMEFEYFDRDDEGNLTDMINAIKGINFDADEGEFIAVVGRNGSGKSTFAKILNRLLAPMEGTVIIDGLDAAEEKNIIPIRKKVGMVFQNPDDQLIGSVVAEDVAFGAENIGIPENRLWDRVLCSIKKAGLADRGQEKKMAARRINELSGGEKQKTAIAGVLAMKPACIVLDEATSMLDAKSRHEILSGMKALCESENITVIIITHIMEEALLADRIYVMDMGKVAMTGRKEKIFADEQVLKSHGLRLPPEALTARYLCDRGIIPRADIYDADSLCEVIYKRYPNRFLNQVKMPEAKLKHNKLNPVNAIIFDGVSFSYGKTPVLNNISLSIAKGEYVAVMGRTGAGKSTLLQMIPAFIKPTSGNVYVDGIDVNDRTTDRRALRCKTGYVFQYPEQQLFARNVYEDVVFGPRNIGVSEVEAEKRAYEAIELVGLSQDVYDMPVRRLSGGQRRRVALAGVLAMKPEYLILDEPLAGLDSCGKDEMLEIIDSLHKEAGITIIMISHDSQSVACYADRVIVLENGEIAGGGFPAEVFYALRDRTDCIPYVMRLLVGLRERGLPVSCMPLAEYNGRSVWSDMSGLEEICTALRRNV